MISPEDFAAVFRRFPSGVALITANVDSAPVALTASSVSSVSAEPPVVMFSVSGKSSSAPALRRAETVIIHLLSAKNLDLAMLGASQGSDRFADADRWSVLPTGEPLFDEASTWIRARIQHRVDAGGSTVFVASVVESHNVDGDEDGLVYRDRLWHRIASSSRIDPHARIAAVA